MSYTSIAMQNNKSASLTFYFHDYETFGKHPAYDRPAQFAGIRTDSDFNILEGEEPLLVYCSLADDYLPDPEAVLITGITPQQANKQGICEAEFAKHIHQAFSVPNTCILGYNNIRFDDEVTRNIFYRNFYDPYAYSWQQGNSRWDLLDLVRACYALRPDGIQWPLNDEGMPSFKLEHLTRANNIEHLHAHDAMSDVYATIAMAKLVKKAQPKLFDYFFKLRNKHQVAALINIPDMTPLVHVSGMFGAFRGNTALVVPLAWHPENKNAVIMCDLAGDMAPLLQLSAEELKTRLYTKRSELAGDEPAVPLKQLHINKCPILAPEKTLRPENRERLGIDYQHCMNNLNLLKQHPEIREKIALIFAQDESFTPQADIDGQLYNGFFSGADKTAMQIILETSPHNLPALDLTFNDPRIKTLLFRYRARNYPKTLTDAEYQRWRLHRQEVLNEETLQQYALKLNELMLMSEGNEEKTRLLKALVSYLQYLLGE